MLEILKDKLRENFLSVLFGFLFSIIAIIGIISFTMVKLAEPGSVKSMKQCTETCEKNVESFSIDPKTQNPICKCKPGIIQRALEKYIEE